MNDAAPSKQRIISIELDEGSIVWRNPDVEQERRVAIFDLIEDNKFVPQRGHPDGYAGPYRLMLRVEDGRLIFEIAREDGSPLEAIILGLGRFRRPIRDYFAICDSYFKAVRSDRANGIETIDMARRALHNDAAELLKDCLEDRIAIFDLLEANHFAPNGHDGPFRITLRVEDNRLAIDLKDADEAHLETIRLGLARFRRPIRDYFAICDSYYQAIKTSTAQQIETVDMARRGLHNEAAEMLMDRLDGKIAVDFDTARRLFTLICVLHIKG